MQKLKIEEKAAKSKIEIEEAISKLDDEKLQMILIYRYIDWMTWYEIAKKVFWSISSVKRKHEQALRELQM